MDLEEDSQNETGPGGFWWSTIWLGAFILGMFAGVFAMFIWLLLTPP